VGTALAHRWEPPFRGGAPPQRLTMGPVKKKPDHLKRVHSGQRQNHRSGVRLDKFQVSVHY
jgi:hypothetical protein